MQWLTKRLLPQLEIDFDRIEKQFNFINRIDKLTLNSNTNGIDEAIKSLCSELMILLKAEEYSISYFSYEKCISILPNIDLIDEKRIRTEIDNNYENLKYDEYAIICDENCLVIPTKINENVFIAFIFVWKKGSEALTYIKNSEFNDFAKTVSGQMSILVQKLLNEHKLISRNNIIETFFNQKLVEVDCWNKIIEGIFNFIPNIENIKIKPMPKIQYLSFKENDKYLSIVATQGDEPSTTKVLVDDSICGMLIKDRSKDYLLVDPQEYGSLYKGFLINEGDKMARSELAIAIKMDQKIIGVLNIEHIKKDIFTEYHIETILDATRYLAPFLSSLKERYESNRRKEIRLVYVLSNLLNRIGCTYQHDLGHPIAKSYLTLEKMENIINNDNIDVENIINDIGKLRKYIEDISYSTERFAESLPEFMSYGPQSIIAMTSKAVDLCDPSGKLKQNDNIEISIDCDSADYYVFASKLLREHIYNLLDNSIDSIKSKFRRNGFIKIIITRKKINDNLNGETATAFIQVVIEDNGGGIKPDKYKQLGTPKFTTKKAFGTGQGFVSAMDYIESIDGKLQHTNNYPEGFTVRMDMHEYDPSIDNSKHM